MSACTSMTWTMEVSVSPRSLDAGRCPIKLMKTDPVAMEAQREEIKTRYGRIFGPL